MPKTIHTTIFGDTPNSSQLVCMDNCVCQLYVIKRDDTAFIQRIAAEIDKPALYILLNRETRKAYIGQTDSFKKRLSSHLSRPFWKEALCFQANNDFIHITVARYLEAIAYDLAKNVGHYDLSENTQIPSKPNITAQNRFSVEEFFGYIQFLAQFVGCDIFAQEKAADARHLFHCIQGGCNATGYLNGDQFIMLAGSEIRPGNRSSITPAFAAQRKAFIADHCEIKKGIPVLKHDCPFSSPSYAAGMCVGGSANGWTEWKDDQGQTLSQVYRK